MWSRYNGVNRDRVDVKSEIQFSFLAVLVSVEIAIGDNMSNNTVNIEPTTDAQMVKQNKGKINVHCF